MNPSYLSKCHNPLPGRAYRRNGPTHRPFPGLGSEREPIPGLQRLKKGTFNWISGKSGTFEFTPPGAHQRYYAVANPIVSGPSGAAKSKLMNTPELRDQRHSTVLYVFAL